MKITNVNFFETDANKVVVHFKYKKGIVKFWVSLSGVHFVSQLGYGLYEKDRQYSMDKINRVLGNQLLSKKTRAAIKKAAAAKHAYGVLNKIKNIKDF